MTPISRSRRLPGTATAAGFTLLELLLVLSIIGLGSLLLAPNVGNLEGRSFSAQARQAHSLLNHARRMAVVSGQPRTATFYAPDLELDERPRAARSSVGVWENSAELRFRDSTEREEDIEDMLEVTFFPEGGSTGGTLLLQLDQQRAFLLIDPFTGRVDLEYDDV